MRYEQRNLGRFDVIKQALNRPCGRGINIVIASTERQNCAQFALRLTFYEIEANRENSEWRNASVHHTS